MSKIRVLTLCDYYLPGHKAGGPIRTLVSMVEQLSDELEFFILTRDRDLGESRPYTGIKPDDWNRVGKARVRYLTPTSCSHGNLAALMRATPHDVLYLNSFFSPHFTIKLLLLRRFGRIPRVPVVLAPRGEFAPTALGLKGTKKKGYLLTAQMLGLYRGVTWQAANEGEKVVVERRFGPHAHVMLAPDLPGLITDAGATGGSRDKLPGEVDILFLSRISRMKNLAGALHCLDGLRGAVRFHIFGPMEDRPYWEECRRIISTLASNVQVRYYGAVPHDEVHLLMSRHDVLLLPSWGESFGHAIWEALAAGCPVLISDRTPWRNLEVPGVGWDLPVEATARFKAALQQVIDMDGETHRRWSHRVREFAIRCSNDRKVLDLNRALFREALQAAPGSGL